jgi:hypothetical protein
VTTTMTTSESFRSVCPCGLHASVSLSHVAFTQSHELRSTGFARAAEHHTRKGRALGRDVTSLHGFVAERRSSVALSAAFKASGTE